MILHLCVCVWTWLQMIQLWFGFEAGEIFSSAFDHRSNKSRIQFGGYGNWKTSKIIFAMDIRNLLKHSKSSVSLMEFSQSILLQFKMKKKKSENTQYESRRYGNILNHFKCRSVLDSTMQNNCLAFENRKMSQISSCHRHSQCETAFKISNFGNFFYLSSGYWRKCVSWMLIILLATKLWPGILINVYDSDNKEKERENQFNFNNELSRNHTCSRSFIEQT